MIGLRDRAAFILAGVNELHRRRGRMSRVTVNDVALLLIVSEALQRPEDGRDESKPVPRTIGGHGRF